MYCTVKDTVNQRSCDVHGLGDRLPEAEWRRFVAAPRLCLRTRSSSPQPGLEGGAWGERGPGQVWHINTVLIHWNTSKCNVSDSTCNYCSQCLYLCLYSYLDLWCWKTNSLSSSVNILLLFYCILFFCSPLFLLHISSHLILSKSFIIINVQHEAKFRFTMLQMKSLFNN